MNDDLLVDLNDYEVIRKLGNGACGDVFLIKEKSNSNLFAAKISKMECKNISDQKSFFREIISLSKAKHPAVLPLIGFNLTNFEGKHFPTIITEYMSKGSLEDILNSDLNLSSTKRYIILLGIAEGMKYLHSIGITHRDLKPGNIVLDDNFLPYISDFGTSKLCDSGLGQVQMESFVGTPIFMAPEILTLEKYTNKVDVYSFSLIMYQLITGNSPKFTEKNKFREIVKAVTEGKRPDLTIITDEEVKSFISRCWSPKPSERPEFNQIVDELKTERFQKLMNVNYNELKDYIQLFDKRISIQNGTYYFTSSSNNSCVSIVNEDDYYLLSSSAKAFEGLEQSFNLSTNDDGTILLRSNFTGYFVGSDPGANKELLANFLTINPRRKFIIEMKSDTEFALKLPADSKYVAIDSNDNMKLKAKSDEIELFTLHQINSIKEGEYFIQSKSNDKIVSAENSYLVANKDSFIGPNEIFRLKHNTADGTISLTSIANKKYVTADSNDEQKCLLAARELNLLWEKFIFIPTSANEFGLLSLSNWKYVMVDLKNESKLRAVSDSIAGSWEVFTFHELNALKDGCYFIESKSNNKIVSAGKGGEEPLASSKENCENKAEMFSLIHNADDTTVSLKSLSNGRYVSVMINEDKKLFPLAKKIDLCEKFVLVPANDSKVEFGLKSVANGKYVMADLNDKSILRAVTDSIAGLKFCSLHKIHIKEDEESSLGENESTSYVEIFQLDSNDDIKDDAKISDLNRLEKFEESSDFFSSFEDDKKDSTLSNIDKSISITSNAGYKAKITDLSSVSDDDDTSDLNTFWF